MTESVGTPTSSVEEIAKVNYERGLLLGIFGVAVGVIIVIFSMMYWITNPSTRPYEDFMVPFGIMFTGLQAYLMTKSCRNYSPK